MNGIEQLTFNNNGRTRKKKKLNHKLRLEDDDNMNNLLNNFDNMIKP